MALSKILLVEDDTDIQKVVRMSLRLRGVKDILVAQDGEECLAVVAGLRPDVILLDVMMPKMDGYETCRNLKANPETRDIPLLTYTTERAGSGEAGDDDDEDDGEESVETGMFVIKPALRMN